VARLNDVIGTKAAVSCLQHNEASRIQKLRCGWLPVNSRESRADPDCQPGCASCSQGSNNLVTETVDHIFQCRGIQRRAILQRKFATLRFDFRVWKTSEHIITALLAGARAWYEGREIPSVESLGLPMDTVGQLVAQAYLDQAALGWNALFRGFWATNWRIAQDAHFNELRSGERQDSGDRWAGKAQRWFYSLFEALWKSRNDVEHGTDLESSTRIRLTKCERSIRRLYEKGATLPHNERHPFRASIDSLLQCRVEEQELWIIKTEEFLPKAFRRTRQRSPNQPLLTDYYESNVSTQIGTSTILLRL
jgi:hypothetical protein